MKLAHFISLAMPDQQLDSVAVKKATTLNEIEDQENSLIQQTHSKTALKGNNFDANNNGDKLGLLITPRAKNVLTNRRVLADKTPNNSKIIILNPLLIFH